MSTEKPTLLLLHGAFHPAEAWDNVITHLSSRGYRCIAPQLCFVGGIGKAPSTWAPCVEQLQQLLSKETSSGRDVVVVNHSFGGIAGCSAIEGYTELSSARLGKGDGHVRGIVQITAM
jgi:alpha-beta hydrolase superfamily lysophospholipase